MHGQWQGSPAVLGVGLLLLQGLTGCATGSDIEKLNTGLTQKVDAMNSIVQAELRELRQELKSAQTKRQKGQQNFVKALHEAQSASKARFDELAAGRAETAQTLKALKEETAEARKAVKDYVAKSVEDFGKIARVADELKAELQKVDRSVRQTLLGTYQAEEAALRERLKVVIKLRQGLQSESPKSAETPTLPGP